MKAHLSLAHNRMKQLADSKRIERSFEEDDWVYLKLHPYRQSSVETRTNQKIAAKYFDPYKVLEKIGKVAYKLELLARSLVHHSFHVSLLKKHYGEPPSTSPRIYEATKILSLIEPETVIDKRIVKKQCS